MKIDVRFVRQPTSSTCVHACLSMVTGVPVEDIMERFGDQGMTNDEETIVLTEHGIMPVSLRVDMAFAYSGVYFLSFPSMNITGAGHRVVVYDDHKLNEWVVLDPNTGRAGKEVYPSDILHRRQTKLWYTDVTFLKPLAGHKGAEERYRRYLHRASEYEVAAEL